MKKFLRMLTEKANEFINDKKTEQNSENNTAILSAIELALKKKSGIHVIFQNKSFTGDIVQYDQERKLLIVMNFNKSLSTIIRIPDIQRVRLVPQTVRVAQKANPKKKYIPVFTNWDLFYI